MLRGPEKKNPSSRTADASGQLWALDQFGRMQVPDARLRQRVIHTAALLLNHPGVSVPQACGSWKDQKGTYRLWENTRVTEEALKKSVAESTAHHCRGLKCILVAEDTTSLHFTAKDRIEDLGPIDETPNDRGLLLHSALAMEEDGTVLGVLHHQVWARDVSEHGCSKNRKHRSFETKESFKWVRTMQGVRRALDSIPEPKQRPFVIHIQDREGDVFEVLEEVVNASEGAVIRSCRNRSVKDAQGKEGKAQDRVRCAPVLMRKTLEVPRKLGKAARKAVVEVRSIPVRIRPPQRPETRSRKPLEFNLVEVWEPHPPAGEVPLHWLLWTTEPVGTAEAAWRIVEIYRKRWRIEEVHLILKSGCRVERLQLEKAERIKKALAMFLPIAVRVLQLKTLARQRPEAPCTEVLSREEWQTLWVMTQGKPRTEEMPVPTIRQAVLWIGQLGGHPGRKRDGLPGVRTLWRGWYDLQIMTEAVRRFYPLRC